jgi:branched-subunit amino acid transport protein
MKLTDLEIRVAILGLVVVVFATRNVFVVVPARWQPRGAVERALRHAPLAALVALTVPQVVGLLLAESLEWSAIWHDARLPAAAATLAVARIANSPFAGLAAGIAVLLALGGLS